MKQLHKNKKPLVITLVIIAVVMLIGYFAFAYFSKAAWPFTTTPAQPSDIVTPSIRQQDKDSQDAKKNNANQETQTPVETVSIAIAFAAYDETEQAIDIRAFTPDVIEAGATCTATLTKDGQTVTKSSNSFIDSTSSQCEPILIPLNEFPVAGSWELTVTYTSPTHTGSSAPMIVEVSE